MVVFIVRRAIKSFQNHGPIAETANVRAVLSEFAFLNHVLFLHVNGAQPTPFKKGSPGEHTPEF